MQLNAIKQMETFARYNPKVISLSQGIPFRTSDSAIRSDVISAILLDKVDIYADPHGIVQLREKIAEQLEALGLHYSSDEILVTAGAMEGLTATMLSLLTNERNEVLIPTPTYSAYFRMVDVAKGQPVFIPLIEDEGWKLDISLLKKRIHAKTAAILLCNPNNPTGTIYSKEELRSVCKLAQQHNIVVILDEVYRNMIFDKHNFYTPCIEQEFKNTIIRVVSFSKDFSLTGWRVGFLHSAKDVIQKIVPVHDALINCVPVVSQYAAISALNNQERIFSENDTIYRENRLLMQHYLDSLAEHFTYTLPLGSYFFFPRFVSNQSSQNFCMDLLRKERLAVVPGSDFGPGGENHIRLCFGKSKETIKEGMERLTKYLMI